MAEYSSLRRPLALRLILLGEAGAGKTCLYHWIKYKVSTTDYSVLQRLSLVEFVVLAVAFYDGNRFMCRV